MYLAGLDHGREVNSTQVWWVNDVWKKGRARDTGLSVSTSSGIQLPGHSNGNLLWLVKSNGHCSVLIFLDHLTLLIIFYLLIVSLLCLSTATMLFICGLLVFSNLLHMSSLIISLSFLFLLCIYSSDAFSSPPCPIKDDSWLVILLIDNKLP